MKHTCKSSSCAGFALSFLDASAAAWKLADGIMEGGSGSIVRMKPMQSVFDGETTSRKRIVRSMKSG